MEFLSAEAIKAYIEIGILGLCGVLTVTMAYLYFKREGKRQEGFDKRTDKIIDKQDERIDKKDNNNQTNFNELLKVIIDQNRQNQELLQKQFVELQNNVVKGVTTHTLSPEEICLKLIKLSISNCLFSISFFNSSIFNLAASISFSHLSIKIAILSSSS